jgi:hypothetical protein
MKEKQNEEGKKDTREQGVNTEETLCTTSDAKEENMTSQQSGSGLIYVGNKKRKASSPPGMRTFKKRKTKWLTF